MYDKLKYVSLLLFCCSCVAFGQTGDAVASANKLEMGISLFYYHPDLDDLNKGFTRAENNFKFPYEAWNDFKVSYLITPTIIYNLNRKSQIVVQASGSYVQRNRQNTKSYYLIWMLGGEFRYRPYGWKRYYTDLYVSAGGGIIGSKFYRSYEGDYALSISTNTFYIDAGVTSSTNVIDGISVNVDLRYIFSPTRKFDNLQSELSLKSIAIGAGVYFAL